MDAAEPVKSETRLVVCIKCGGPHDAQNCERALDPESASDSDGDLIVSNSATEMTSHPLQDCRFVGGRYEVLELIGQGGAGSVYRVKHQALNKIFALKALNTGVSSDEKTLRRFDAEAKTVGNLSNPYLIQVHDYGVTDSGTPYLVLDYIEGTNLADEISRLGHIDEARALALFSKVCEGLEHAHANQIVHRDLKPSNIMLLRDDQGNEIPKIVDFGIAKRQAMDNSVTQTGEIFGTPLYMSPEQCVGKSVDSRSDIYSLGCVMYEALTGVPPLVGSNPVETVLRHINDEPAPFKKACTGWKISPETERVVMSCLEKDAKRRPENCQSVQRNLDLISKGEKPWVRRAAPRWKPNRKLVTLAVIALTVISFISGSFLVIGGLQLWQTNALKLNPFDRYIYQAEELDEHKQYKEGIGLLLKALEQPGLSNEQLMNCYFMLSRKYSKLGDSDKSNQFYDKALRSVKLVRDKSQAFLYYYGAADKADDPLRQIELNEEAIALWAEAYPRQPDYLFHPLVNVIKEYSKLKMWDKAAERLNYARQIIQQNSKVSSNYKMQIADWSGYVFASTGRLDKALASFRTAEQIANMNYHTDYAQVIEREEKHVLRVMHRNSEADKIFGDEHVWAAYLLKVVCADWLSSFTYRRCHRNAKFEEYDVITMDRPGITVMLKSFESSLLFDTRSGAL